MTCIYCLGGQPITSAHLFPRSMGGRCAVEMVCQKCNSLIGAGIEGEVKKFLCFAEPIAQLGIQPRDKAFEKIKVYKQETGERLKYDGNLLQNIPGVRSDGRLTGSLESIIQRTIKFIREKYPNWEEHYKQAVRRGDLRVRVCDREFVIIPENSKGPVVHEGQQGYPYSLLAKIAYEALWGFGFYDRSINIAFLNEHFLLSGPIGNRTSIQVRESFVQRIDPLSTVYRKTGEVSVHSSPLDYHRLDFRVTKNGIGYIVIEMFGSMRYSVILGPVTVTVVGEEYVNKRVICFPIFGVPALFYEDFPEDNENIRIVKDMEDARAELRWNGLL